MMARRIAYWVTTGLVAFVFLSSGVVNIARPGFATEAMTRLGYPGYFVPFLGVWKVLGGNAVLAPGLPRLKEWAYAGMIFDLTGAAVSHAAAGDPAGAAVFPLLFAGLVMASWALRPESRKLRGDSRGPTGLLRPKHSRVDLEAVR